MVQYIEFGKADGGNSWFQICGFLVWYSPRTLGAKISRNIQPTGKLDESEILTRNDLTFEIGE